MNYSRVFGNGLELYSAGAAGLVMPGEPSGVSGASDGRASGISFVSDIPGVLESAFDASVGRVRGLRLNRGRRVE